MILADVKFQIRQEDREAMNAANEFRPCPFTSVAMCAPCAAHERSPARKLSSPYAKLASDLDSNLLMALQQTAAFEQTILGARN